MRKRIPLRPAFGLASFLVLAQHALGAAAGSLGVTSTSYLSNPGALQQSEFSLVELKGSASHLGSEVHLGLDYQLALGLRCPDCNAVELPQAYIGSAPELGRWSIQFGRVKKEWSALDRAWQLGIYQPRFVYDYLHPEPVGLLGLFSEYRLPRGGLTFFASPVFVPDRGLPVSFENGKVGSVDPFFHAPISEVVYQNQVTPIQYILKRPPVTDLLFKPSMGVSAQLGDPATGLSMTAGYAYKPVNQLLLAYSALYNLSFEVADAEVYPRVLMHHVGSGDLAYRSERISFGVSALHEVPVRDKTPKIWNTQEITPAWALSPHMELRPMGRDAESPAFTASALRVWGGNGADQGPLSVTEGTAFALRYPQRVAFKLGAKARLWNRTRFKSEALLDLEHGSQLYSHMIQGELSNRVSWQLSADILYSEALSEDFISKNRTNDRFGGGVSYVF